MVLVVADALAQYVDDPAAADFPLQASEELAAGGRCRASMATVVLRPRVGWRAGRRIVG